MKKSVAKFTSLGLAAVLCAGLAGCGSSKDAGSQTLKIGLATPLTGTSAQDGQSIQNGVNLAVKLCNEAGGINGKQVEVVAEDDKGDSSEAATVANKLAQDEDILAIVGHFNSSCTLAGAPIYNQAGVVEVSPGSSAASVTDAGDYTFRVITTDAVQGDFLADWCVNELGYTNIAILYENSDYGLGLADVAEEATTALGATVVIKDAYEVGATDFSTVLTKVANADPDVLIIGGLYNETALIAKQKGNYGLEDLQIMGVDAIFSNALIDLGGDAVNGIKLTSYFSADSENEVSKAFVEAYEAEYNETPGTYAAYAYDAALIVLDAIENGGEDRASVQSYMASLQDFPGATGTISFDENGDAIKDPMKMEIQDGAFAVID